MIQTKLAKPKNQLIKKALKFFKTQLIGLIGSLFIIVLLIYTQSIDYIFPKNKPFNGSKIYNPYQNVGNTTQKANFHAHSIAWGGLTNGHNSPEELKKSYQKKGYSYCAISNYFNHNPLNGPLQVYEHGINVAKAHCLAIGATKVALFDYPILQNLSQKQDIINRLKANQALVAIAHPGVRGGHGEADMRELVGYSFTEVLNHYYVSDNEWDAALMAGRLSWILANDDTHDIHKEPTFMIWNEIYGAKADILENLKAGKNYGIKTKNGINDLTIKYLQVINDSIKFDFGANATSLICIMDGKKQDFNFGKGSILFPKNAHFIRFVASSNQAQLYTNPIVHYNGTSPQLASQMVAKVHVFGTILQRLQYWLLIVIAIYYMYQNSIKNLAKKLKKPIPNLSELALS